MAAQADPTTWLITRCSTGLGRALARAVLERADLDAWEATTCGTGFAGAAS